MKEFEEKYVPVEEKKTNEDAKIDEKTAILESSSPDSIWKKLWEIFLDEFLNHEILSKVFFH